MLFGKILRSSEAHARIKRLDVAKALALPGVRSVLTARDIPQIRFGTAIKDRTIFCGAFANSGPATAAIALQVLAGPYRTPHLAFEGIAVYTNKGATGSFRAPAGPMANFAVELQMDLIADDLGIDPLEFRLRNVYREGAKGPADETLSSVSIEECLRKRPMRSGGVKRKPSGGAARASRAPGG